MFRKTQTILGLALCVAALTSLSACGQKGDLVLPSSKPQVLPRGPASAPASAPALPLRQP
jgi:predicted small lipoprotein YifL